MSRSAFLALLTALLLQCRLPAFESNRSALLGLIGKESGSLVISLPRFDDAALQAAAAAAVSRGARVRVILSRREKASRLAAKGLRAAGIQIRWAPKVTGRYLASGSGKLALGNFDGHAESLDAPMTGLAVISDASLAAEFSARFDDEWQGLKDALPSETALKDELEALPDPRENEPRLRVKRRRN